MIPWFLPSNIEAFRKTMKNIGLKRFGDRYKYYYYHREGE